DFQKGPIVNYLLDEIKYIGFNLRKLLYFENIFNRLHTFVTKRHAMAKNEKVTIYDISKKLNISAATVSRALNNNPKISHKTRELVMKTAQELNYKQNRLALALKSGKNNGIGVIVPYMNRNFFWGVTYGIDKLLAPYGYNVIICQSQYDDLNDVNHITALSN